MISLKPVEESKWSVVGVPERMQKAVRILNDLLSLDPEAASALVFTEVALNPAATGYVTAHDSLIVGTRNGLTGLGLLNGLLKERNFIVHMETAGGVAVRAGISMGISDPNMREVQEFTCPVCGGHAFGTSHGDGECHGYILGRPCTFTWSRTGDAQYFKGMGDFVAIGGVAQSTLKPKETK